MIQKFQSGVVYLWACIVYRSFIGIYLVPCYPSRQEEGFCHPIVFARYNSWMACLQIEEVILCYVDGITQPLQCLYVCRLKLELSMLHWGSRILTSEFTSSATVTDLVLAQYDKLKRCLNKECCKQCRYVMFKGTMTKWPVQKLTQGTTQKLVQHHDATDI